MATDAEYEKLIAEATAAFSRADIPEVIRAFDRGFGVDTYSLKSLFRDEQRSILSQILISTLDEAEAAYRQLYEHHAPLMRFLIDLKTPLPKAFRTTAEYALNSHLRRAFSDELDAGRIRSLLEEARLGGVDLDATTLEYTLRKTIERMAGRLREDPDEPGRSSRVAPGGGTHGRITFCRDALDRTKHRLRSFAAGLPFHAGGGGNRC